MTSDLMLELRQAAESPGEIRLASLGPLASALQEVYDRLGRLVDERPGPGRTPAILGLLTQLTLVDLREGSTGLALRRGDDTALDVEPLEAREVDARFEELVHAMVAGVPPAWVTPALAGSTVKLITALRRSAPLVVVTASGGSTVDLATEELQTGGWADRTVREAEDVVVVGRLEAVDLDRGAFRVRDDVGNRIPLVDVVDPDGTAPFIGRRVRAAGTAARRADGSLREVRRPTLAEHALPAQWSSSARTNLGRLLADATGPDTSEPLNLSDEEFDAFLKAARGR